MTDKKKVVVNINDQDYTVVSVEEVEYIKKIARTVDEDIKEILSKNTKLSNTMAAVLAAFNMTDRYYKNLSKLDGMKENVLEPLKELEAIKAKLKEYEQKEETIKEEYEEKVKVIEETNSKELEELTIDNEEMKNEIEELRKEVENLTKKNKKYENAIEIKDNDLLNNQKVINDLQDKIFEHQMEVMQTKKQLEVSLKRLDDK